MKNDLLYDNFIEAIKEKIPERTKIAHVLMDILSIEKEAVYRRLRREVPFTFAEVASISSKLGILLDNIVCSGHTNDRPFHMKLYERDETPDIGRRLLSQFTSVLQQGVLHEKTEVACASNILPQSLYYHYDSLSRFYLFKWFYQYGDPTLVRNYRDISLSPADSEARCRFIAYAQNAESTSFVWDHMILYYLVNDIRYFAGIQMISEGEQAEMKNDLFLLVDRIEEIAATGAYPATGKKVNLYISDINFDTSYCYISTPRQKLSMIRAFTLNAVATSDERTYERLKNYITSLQRLSSLISVTGEKQRKRFFSDQRKLIDNM